MCHPLRIDLELGILLPLGPPETITEDAEQTVVAAAKEDISVFGLERFVWDDRSCFAY